MYYFQILVSKISILILHMLIIQLNKLDNTAQAYIMIHDAFNIITIFFYIQHNSALCYNLSCQVRIY